MVIAVSDLCLLLLYGGINMKNNLFAYLFSERVQLIVQLLQTSKCLLQVSNFNTLFTDDTKCFQEGEKWWKWSLRIS